MAKVVYGAGVSQMSGKQGGTVFSRNKSGAYTRTNRKGTNPNTAAQQARRQTFSQASRYFSTLTAVQQQSFKDNAINYPQIDRLGQTVTLSGAQLAAKFANLQNLAGQAATAQEMGSPVFVPSGLGFSIGGSNSGGNIANLTIDLIFLLEDGSQTDEVPTGFKLVVKATKLMSNGFTAPKKKDYRVIEIVGVATAITNYGIQTSYQSIFGAAVVGGDYKMFIQVELVSILTPQSSVLASGSKTFAQ